MKKILAQDSNNLSFPVFPLSAFILPGGKIRLRIFEEKYLRMLSLISSHQMFVIQQVSQSSVLANNYWGSLVKIEDFNQGEDGLLEIDVHCRELVNLSETKLDENNLAFSKIKPFIHWSQNNIDEDISSSVLTTSLNDLINNDNLLCHLYQRKALNNIHWVVARWIELLPVSLKVKNQFVSVNDFSQANDFVNSVIYK